MADNIKAQLASVIRSSMESVLEQELTKLKANFQDRHGFRGRTAQSMRFDTIELADRISFELRSRRVRAANGDLVDLIQILNEGTSPYLSPPRKLLTWVRQKLGQDLKEARRTSFAISVKHSQDGNPVRENRGWFDNNFDEGRLIKAMETAIENGITNFEFDI
jgi:hypothetical protein